MFKRMFLNYTKKQCFDLKVFKILTTIIFSSKQNSLFVTESVPIGSTDSNHLLSLKY